jgi:hypothetical protein
MGAEVKVWLWSCKDVESGCLGVIPSKRQPFICFHGRVPANGSARLEQTVPKAKTRRCCGVTRLPCFRGNTAFSVTLCVETMSQ